MKKIPKGRIKKSKAWRPPRIQGVGIHSNSWFTINKIQLDSVVKSNKKINTSNIRCEQIILKPNVRQRHLLFTWFDLTRISYNLGVKKLRKDYYDKPKNPIKSMNKFRDYVKKEMRNIPYISSIIKKSEIYQQTLDEAVRDVWKAKVVCLSNLKLGHIKHFRLRYKKKDYHIKNLVIDKSALNNEGTGLKKDALKDLNPIKPIRTNKTVRIGYNTRTKIFTMYVPYDKNNISNYTRESTCALDPGIRTFQTLYSPTGSVYEFNDSKDIITKTLHRIDKVKEFEKKKWYKKYIDRLKKKLKNRITDLHWKTAVFLCKNFDTIKVGNMSTKSIVSRNLNLPSITKRKVYSLSHFLFKLRLKSKAEEYNCNFTEVDESYTSKTCGGCGEINENLGSSEVFKCPKDDCNYIQSRDIHAARNIYIKHN